MLPACGGRGHVGISSVSVLSLYPSPVFLSFFSSSISSVPFLLETIQNVP